MKRGDIYFADLNPVIGSEQGGIRPVLIIQNDYGNRYAPTVIIAAITSRKKAKLPTHVKLNYCRELQAYSMILLEQIRTIDKERLKLFLGTIDEKTMRSVNRALGISVGILR